MFQLLDTARDKGLAHPMFKFMNVLPPPVKLSYTRERKSQLTYNLIYYTAYIRMCYYQNQRRGETEKEREGQRRKLTLFASFVTQSSEEKFIVYFFHLITSLHTFIVIRHQLQ